MHRLPPFVALLLAVSCSLSAADTITAGWEPYAPYQFAGDDGPQGLDVDLLEAIANHAGITVQWLEAPWKRQLLMIENGTLDVAVSASFTEQREQYAHFSTPYRREEPVLFVPEGQVDNHEFATLDALLGASDFKLGVARGYVYSPDWEQRIAAGVTCQIIEATTEEHLVRILAAGRIDGALLDRFSGSHMINQLNAADQTDRHPLVASSVPIHVMASRLAVDDATLARLNAAITALEDDGTLPAIRARYDAP